MTLGHPAFVLPGALGVGYFFWSLFGEYHLHIDMSIDCLVRAPTLVK